MDPIEIRYTLTQDEFMKACSAHWRAHRQGTSSQVIAGSVGVVMAIVAWDLVHILAVALLVVGLLIWCVPVLRWLLYRRAFREAKKYTEDIHAVFSHDGIHIDSAEGTSDLNWGFYSKYIETPDFVLLYMTRHQFSVIPKSAFTGADQALRFVDLVDSRLERSR